MGTEIPRTRKSKGFCGDDDTARRDDIVSERPSPALSTAGKDFTSYKLTYRLRSFTRSFADGMVHEYTPRVPSAFLILPALKPVINNTADVTLIGVIYRIVKNCCCWLTGDHKGYEIWQLFHHGAIFLLAIFALADTAFYIYVQVLLFVTDTVDHRLVEVAARYKDIHLTYTTLYLAVSIEILTFVAFLFVQTRRQNLRNRVSVSSHLAFLATRMTSRNLILHGQIITYLATLISPPLVLRSAVILAVAIRYSFQSYSESHVLSIVTTALGGFLSVVIFIGALLVQFNKDWFVGPRDDVSPTQTVQTTREGLVWA